MQIKNSSNIEKFLMGLKFREAIEKYIIQDESGVLILHVPSKFSAKDFLLKDYLFNARVELEKRGYEVILNDLKNKRWALVYRPSSGVA